MYRHYLTGGAAAIALMTAMSSVSYAQEVTSSIRGQIVGPDGGALGGATVSITHVPTGSTSTVTTSAGGTFTAQGLRVGGPYDVVASASGYQTKRAEGVFLTLGETESVIIQLADSASTAGVDEVVVTARQIAAAQVAIGPNVSFGLSELEDRPAINRDLRDIVRADPRIYIDDTFVDAIQCAGQNPRFNSLTVDGVRKNDGFGLNSNGYPTERMPFPYDAIEQVSVELAPFDVEYGGFTACNINAVTKSGTNEFHGSLFYDFFDDSLISDKLEGDSIDNGSFEETRYGAVVSGPIIPNRLFFTVGYEYLEGANVFDRSAVDGNGARQVQGVTQEQLDEIREIAIDVYGFDPGDIASSAPNEDEKILARVDWNITDNHRLAFIYNWNDGFNINEADGDDDEIEFDSHLYERGAELTSYTGQLFSDWTDAFSTELRWSYSELDNRQISNTNNGVGEVAILTRNSGTGQTATVYLGQDDSRSANQLSYENWTGKAAANYVWNNHTFTVGYEIEKYEIFNLFIQEVNGEFEFDDFDAVLLDDDAMIDAFRNGEVVSIEYQNAAGSNNPADAAAEFGYDIHTLYAQDEIFFDELGLTLVAGFRYDWYASDDNPRLNENVAPRYGFDNTSNLDGKDLFQPRLGFSFDPTENVSIHGGIGLFSGGNPNVWISNNYSNDGATVIDPFPPVSGDIGGEDGGADLVFVDSTGAVIDNSLALYGVPQTSFDAVAGGTTDSGINFLDPNFVIPSIWKLNLGATVLLPGDYTLALDALFTQNKDSAIVRDMTQILIGTGSDGRGVYEDYDLGDEGDDGLADNGCNPVPGDADECGSRGFPTDFLLTNVDDGGQARIFSASLSKSYDWGLDWSVGYAYTSSEDVNPMTSSVAFSNFANIAVSDFNNPETATSNYEIPHRFTAAFDFKRAFFGDYMTKVSVLGVIQEGAPYSYVFSDDIDVNDPVDGRQLLYVPTGADDTRVIFDGGFDTDAFFAYIADNGLDAYAGEIAPRNAFNSSWNSRIDMTLKQELPGVFASHRSIAYVTFENLGNLLNDEWGIVNRHGFPGAVGIVDGTYDLASDTYTFSSFQPINESRQGEPSQWKIRFGVRYEF